MRCPDKTETTRAYDAFPEYFERKFSRTLAVPSVQAMLREFVALLPEQRVLDIGSGPGLHARELQSRGCDVTCGDISEKMLELCRARGLRAEYTDIETFSVTKPYDGIWAFAVLLHVPKERVPQAIERLRNAVRMGGIVALAVQEGSGEGFEEREELPGTRRWFTRFSDNEIRDLFRSNFELVFHVQHDIAGSRRRCTFLHYLFRRTS